MSHGMNYLSKDDERDKNAVTFTLLQKLATKRQRRRIKALRKAVKQVTTKIVKAADLIKTKNRWPKKIYRTNKDTIVLNVEHFPPHFLPQPEEFDQLSYGSKEIELEALRGYKQGLRKILRGAKKCKGGKMKRKNKGKVGMRRKPNLTTILLNAQSPCSEGCEVVLNPGKFRKAYDTDDLDTSSSCYKFCPGWIRPRDSSFDPRLVVGFGSKRKKEGK